MENLGKSKGVIYKGHHGGVERLHHADEESYIPLLASIQHE